MTAGGDWEGWRIFRGYRL